MSLRSLARWLLVRSHSTLSTTVDHPDKNARRHIANCARRCARTYNNATDDDADGNSDHVRILNTHSAAAVS